MQGLTPVQVKYLNDVRHRFFVNSSGRRSRKTLIGSRKILMAALRNPETRYFQAAPVFAQAREIFWEKLKRNAGAFAANISETRSCITLMNGSFIQVSGLDRPERIEGREWHGGHITETGNTKPGFWEEHIRPCFSDTGGFCIFDGTPEGRNHYYNMALYAAGGVIPETMPRIGAYSENKKDPDWVFYSWFSSDVLDAQEIEKARNELDPRTFQQEYEGGFLSYAGMLYYNFTRDNVNDEIAKYHYDEPIYLSCDFNKSPMVWELGARRGRIGVIFDEINIPYNAKTQGAAQEFVTRYSKHANRTVYLTGDASGAYEDHRDFSTDYRIITDILQANGWRVVIDVQLANPSVNNRVNVACSLFSSYSGQKRIFINSVCHKLIDDLEKNESDGKGGKDKSDQNQTHASDAFDYLVWLWFAGEFYKNNIVQY